jgi:hypothetical protein
MMRRGAKTLSKVFSRGFLYGSRMARYDSNVNIRRKSRVETSGGLDAAAAGAAIGAGRIYEYVEGKWQTIELILVL